jgi:hypothetical protein
MGADQRASMLRSVSGCWHSDRLQVLANASGIEHVVLQRLCLALAAIAARSGNAAGAQLVEQALQLAAAAAASSAHVCCVLRCIWTLLIACGWLDGTFQEYLAEHAMRLLAVRSRWRWRYSY